MWLVYLLYKQEIYELLLHWVKICLDVFEPFLGFYDNPGINSSTNVSYSGHNGKNATWGKLKIADQKFLTLL